jgi:diacylglycerol O-acyltransferase
MRHLSALDALFLQLETPETPMHVGSLMRLAKPPGRSSAYFAAYRRLIASRLHLAPLFSRKLAFMPLDIASPTWQDADEVDLDYHIGRIRLPAPGSDAQLEKAVAGLHEGMLDRSRPLWRFTVIEGLANGDIGVYAKIHHAALDGEGGIAVAQAILDDKKVGGGRRSEVAETAQPRSTPSAVKMIGAALRNTVAQYGRMLKSAPEALRAAGRAAAVTVTGGGIRKRGLALGPRTRLNHAIGAKRLFVAMQIPLAEAKTIARHFDAKLNDAVLAVCAGALRRYFAGDRLALAKAMIGAVPVSLRAPGDTSRANDVSMMLISLATHIADPRKRMQAIVAASTRAKRLTGSMKGAIPTDLPSLGIPWLMASLVPLYRKAVGAERIPVLANVAISNVPGPQVPLYLAGAELKAYYPVSIVAHGLALNVTIVSYRGSLDFGLVAAKDAMPDLRRFARHLKAAHAELLEITQSP